MDHGERAQATWNNRAITTVMSVGTMMSRTGDGTAVTATRRRLTTATEQAQEDMIQSLNTTTTSSTTSTRKRPMVARSSTEENTDASQQNRRRTVPQRAQDEPTADTSFMLLTPLEAGFPALPSVSVTTRNNETRASRAQDPPSIEYVGGRNDANMMVTPRPPPPVALLNEEEEEDDAELSILFNATRQRLPSIKLRPRQSCQRQDFWHDREQSLTF